MRPVLPSRAAELKYRAELRGAVVAQCRRAGDDVLHGMRSHWPSTHDSVAPGLGPLTEETATHFGNIQHTAERLAKAAATRTLAGVDERLTKNLLRAVGVDVSGLLGLGLHGAEVEPPIVGALREAVAANVDLIVSIPKQYLEKVGAAVEASFAAGQRWEELAKEIKRIGDVTDTRAKIIARDQTSKLNADFNRVRQTGLGIEAYTWSGALDKRERTSHRAMEGRRIRWDSPPEVDGERVHAGEAILCRCVAVPALDFEELAPAGAAMQEAA